MNNYDSTTLATLCYYEALGPLPEREHKKLARLKAISHAENESSIECFNKPAKAHLKPAETLLVPSVGWGWSESMEEWQLNESERGIEAGGYRQMFKGMRRYAKE